MFEIDDSFWSKVDVLGPDDCWEWQGSRNSVGGCYGRFRVASKMELAHRVAFLRSGGTLAARQVVRHKCDNPPCCNPRHLVSGSQSDNMKDMQQRGRENKARGDAHGLRANPAAAARGLQNGNARLEDWRIADMRSRYVPGVVRLADLAAEHGCSTSYVSYVVRGKNRTTC